MSLFVKEITCENEFPDIVSVVCVNGSGVLDERDYVPERTCRNAWKYGGDVFQCSECGCQLALDDGYGNTIEFADVPKQSYPNKPMYCVGCGAKVVGD